MKILRRGFAAAVLLFLFSSPSLYSATAPRVPLRNAFLQTPLDGNQETITNLADVELSGFPLGPLTNLLGGVTYLEEWGQLDPSTFEGGGGLTNRFEKIGIGPDPFTPERPLHIKTELGAGVVGPTIIQENTNAVENARAWFSTVGTSETFPSVSMIWGLFYDAFTQTNRLMALDASGVLTTTGGMVAPSFNDGSDLREDINDKVTQFEFNDAYATVVRNDQTNALAAINTLRDLYWRHAPIIHLTNSTLEVDWDSSNVFRMTLTNHLTITEINIPASGFKTGGILDVYSPTDSAESWNLGMPERWRPNPVLPLPALGPGQHLKIWWWNWEHEDTHESIGEYSSEGNQALQLPPIYGGTGTPLGMAVTPRATTFYPTPYSASTNWIAELSRGTEAIVLQLTDDMHFISSDGKPATTNETTWAEYAVHNFSGFDWNFSARADWLHAGFGAAWPYAISNGTTLYFKVKAQGPSETNVVVRNLLPTSLVSGGGGAPPPSTLGDGLMAHSGMDDVSDTFADNGTAAGSIYDWTTVTVSRTAVGYPGQINTCWTNGVGGGTTILTNMHIDLRVPADGIRTYAWWSKRYAPSFGTHIAHGPSTGGANYGWFADISSGSLRFTHSTSGTAFQTGLTFGLASSAEVWEFWVLEVNNVANVARASKDGSLFVTVNLAGDTFASTAPLALLGSSSEGTKISGLLDDVVVWNRALSQSEVEEAALVPDWTVFY